MPELLLLEDELELGEGLEKHPERSIGSGELQIDDSKRRTRENLPKLVREGISVRPLWRQ